MRTLVISILVSLFALTVLTAGAAPALAASDTATVLEVGGSDLVRVRTDSGSEYWVQFIGVHGPPMGGRLHAESTAAAAELLDGQRVRLTDEGVADTFVLGYGLVERRHVYVGDSANPVATDLLGNGWLWTAPDPPAHAYHDWYIQLQEIAVNNQAGVWFTRAEDSTVAIWRPDNSGVPSGYLIADTRMFESLDSLYTTQRGKEGLDVLMAHPVTVGFGSAPEGSLAYFDPQTYYVLASNEWVDSDPWAVAALLAHELLHARDYVWEVLDVASFGCYEDEVRAFRASADIWELAYGPEGKQPPADGLDEEMNATLELRQAGLIPLSVAARYGHQCGSGG